MVLAVWHQRLLEICDCIRDSRRPVFLTRERPQRLKLVLSVWHERSLKSVMVSETVADQCMNKRNSIVALNKGLKLVLTRLAPGNSCNVRACKRLRSGVPRYLNWS